MPVARQPSWGMSGLITSANASDRDHTSGGATLRRTCRACAASKLKCSSEKPTCARCARRGQTCSYATAMRGGRKPNVRSSVDRSNCSKTSSTSTQTSGCEASGLSGDWSTSLSSTSSKGSLWSPALPPHTEGQDTTTLQDLASNMIEASDQMLFTSQTNADINLVDLFATPAATLDMRDLDLFDSMGLLPSTHDDQNSWSLNSFTDGITGFEETIPELFTCSAQDSISDPSASCASSAQNHSQASCSNSMSGSSSCLIKALGLMRQLSDPVHTESCLSWCQQDSDQTLRLEFVQGVLAQNDTILESVNTMIECKCSAQDGYLLMLMSLIIFKVLGWYHVVVRGTSSSQLCSANDHAHESIESEHQQIQRQPHPHTKKEKQRQTLTQQKRAVPSIGVDYLLHSEDSGRTSVQLVMNELHRVRKLVNPLSARLKARVALSNKSDTVADSDGESESVDSNIHMTLPLSSAIYRDLETGLQTRLRALSRDTLKCLKRL